MLQKGHLLLNGNSCIWNNQHIAFCGESGTGKSSLAAQFHKAGALFFCDEIICFDKNNNALPGYPFLRLWNNDVEHNNFRPSFVSKLWDHAEKYKVNTSKQKCNSQKNLDILIYLEIIDSLPSPQFQEIKGVEKFKIFTASFYHQAIISAMNLEEKFNQQAISILQTTKVIKLSRPNYKESRLDCFNLIKKRLHEFQS